MRFSLLASAVALASATATSDQFDDDDLNFLRMLSSNSSAGNGTAATTATPATTTVAATTTVVSNATTTAAAATTTLAATTTVAPAGSENTTVATETSAPTTGAPQSGGGDGGDTTKPAVTAMCSDLSYVNLGLDALSSYPATTSTALFMLDNSECEKTLDRSSAEKSMFKYGAQADTTENKAKCSAATAFKCDMTVEMYNGMADDQFKAGLLQFCCGVSGSGHIAGSPTLASPLTGGSFSVSEFTDSACSVPATAADMDWIGKEFYAGSHSVSMDVGACFYRAGLYMWEGAGFKITMCNGTDTQGMHISEMHPTADCSTGPMAVGVGSQQACSGGDRRRSLRMLSENSTKLYSSVVCAGGAAPEKMEIATSYEVTLAGIPATAPAAVKTAATESAGKSVLDAQIAVVGASGTVTVSSCAAVGGPLDGTSCMGIASRRRLRKTSTRRRLASHASKVAVTLKTEVAYASADTLKTTLETAVGSGGALSTTTLATAVVADITASANSDLAALATNLTVTVAAPVVSAPTVVVPAAGGAGGTSGAVEMHTVGVFAALFTAIFALIM